MPSVTNPMESLNASDSERRKAGLPPLLRTVHSGDLPLLLELERQCWPEALAAGEPSIRRRLELHPEGQLGLELEGKLVAVVYTQQIRALEQLRSTNADRVHELHDSEGPVLQLLAINVFPALQHMALGDRLLELALEKAKTEWGLRQATAVTRCKNAPASGTHYRDYVFARDANGLLADPILRFHDLHGCRIEAILPGYRPLDRENEGNGVLIFYDLVQRRTRIGGERSGHEGGEIDSPVRPFASPAGVSDAIRALMGARADQFSPDRALMDLGLDSLDLYGLRAMLSQSLGFEVDPTFFFRYPTARAIQEHLEGREPKRRERAGAAGEFQLQRVDRPLEEHEASAGEGNEPASSLACQPSRGGAIAVIGMACRFPGGADTPESYWKLLRDGVDAVGEVPASRWNMESYFDENRHVAGKIVSRYGGFLDQIAGFDTRYFEISPREAKSTDPQQRLLLELAVEALERAGIAPSSLAGSRTANFVGIFSHDYELLQLTRQLPDSYYATGNSASMAAGRVSYVLGLEGPALAIDTACSASLAAIHLACRSLRAGESELALASGVNLILSPELSMSFSRAGMLSKDGRCRSFDRDAKGYVRSEGAGTLVLKPLEQALRDRDPILAVIRGTALNQDGASNGLTAPNGLAQEAVIRAALADAGARPHEIDFIEAHGTGTSLGDPIEWQALESVFAPGRDPEQPLLVGSVKSNLGHAEAAAGMAGVMKMILAIGAKYLPPNLHFREPNPLLRYGESPLRVVARGRDWQLAANRAVGVSSFGFSGTNGHLILGPPPLADAASSVESPRPELLLLSAKSDEALKAQLEQFRSWLNKEQAESASLADICHTAATGRDLHERRFAAVVGDMQALRDALDCEAPASGSGWQSFVGPSSSVKQAPLCWLFSGQGSQYSGMGRELGDEPAFRLALERCDRLLRAEFSIPLLELLFHSPTAEGPASALDDTAYTQPALFALEYALAQTWLDWGVEPDAVMGHSVGEFAAACIAGVFSLEDGLRLIATRARLMAALPRNGGMTAIFAAPDLVLAALAEHAERVSLAAVNGPELCVISGDKTLVDEIAQAFAAKGVRVSALAVSHAFHSPLMRPMLAEFHEYVQGLELHPPRLTLISNLSGKPVGAEIARADYWREHVLAPVQFAAAIEYAQASGVRRFLEIGPQPVLIGMARKFAMGDLIWLPALARGRDAREAMLAACAALFTAGATPRFSRLYPRQRYRPITMPTYPFQRKNYWLAEAGPQHDLKRVGKDHLQSDPDALIRLVEASNQFRAEEVAFAHKLISFLHNATLTAAERQEERNVDDLYQLRWLPAGPAEGATVSAFPQPADFAELLAAKAARSHSDTAASHGERLDRFGQPFIDEAALTPYMEQLGQAYVLQTFERLGWRFEPGQIFRAEALADQLGIDTQHRRLLGHLLGLLRQKDYLGQSAELWHCLRPLPRTQAHALREQLLEAFPSAKLEIELLSHCGEHLTEVLRGTRDPVQLIFPSANVATAVNLYQDSATFGGMNRQMGDLIHELVRRLPPGHKLRILEIGGGTGGTTAHVLPHLPPENCEYVFTDLSAFFTEKARARFSIYPFVRYKILNIESDPLPQGFVAGHFDLIIAANVLHATKDLVLTLRHATQLLRPGGWLLPLEGIEARLWIDLIFGLLDGWWRFSDHELRPAHPLLTAQTWHQVLAANGYETSAIVTSPAGDQALFPQAILLAKKAKRGECERSRRLHLLEAPFQSDAHPESCEQEPGASPHRPSTQTQLTQLLFTSAELRLHSPFLQQLIDAQPDAIVLSFPTSDPRELTARSREYLRQALVLLQSLEFFPSDRRPQLWFVTHGAQLAIDPNGLSQAPVWGLIKSAFAEKPHDRLRLIDLEPGPVGAEQLLEEFRLADNLEAAEPLLAWRGGVRHLLRFEPMAPPELDHGELPIDPDASYLVTGGTGGMGRLFIRRLVEQGARRILSFGRHAPTSEILAEFSQYRDCEIRHLCCDVGDGPAFSQHLSRELAAFAAKGHPLRGLIHCAGIFEDRLIDQHDEDSFDRVLRPKLDGAWALHRAVLSEKLDFFVLCSSFFSALGESGLANYVAANNFLDALARLRTESGLPATSVQWGPWSGTGMAESAGSKGRNLWQTRGIRTLAPDRALDLLAGLIRAESETAAVVQLDPGRYALSCADLPQATALAHFAPADHDRAEETDLLEALANAEPAERPALLTSRLARMLAEILGFHSGEKLDPEAGFFQLGLDSLTTLELRNRMQHQLHRPIPETLLFKYPTLHTLVTHLLEELTASAPEFADLPAVQAEPRAQVESQLSPNHFPEPATDSPQPGSGILQKLDPSPHSAEAQLSLLAQLEALESLLKAVP